MTCPLTRQELAILRLISEGLRYREIAERMGLRRGTIGNYICDMHNKTGSRSSIMLVVRALREGWI